MSAAADLTEFDRFVLRLFERAGSFDRAKRAFARAVVRAAMRESGGNKCEAARRLKIHRNTLDRYLPRRMDDEERRDD